MVVFRSDRLRLIHHSAEFSPILNVKINILSLSPEIVGEVERTGRRQRRHDSGNLFVRGRGTAKFYN